MPQAGQKIATDNLPIVTPFTAAKTMYWATVADNTDASGALVVNHNLGFVPSAVFCQSSSTNAIQVCNSVSQYNWTTTTFTSYWRRTDTGAALASTPVVAMFLICE